MRRLRLYALALVLEVAFAVLVVGLASAAYKPSGGGLASVSLYHYLLTILLEVLLLLGATGVAVWVLVALPGYAAAPASDGSATDLEELDHVD